MNDWDQMKDEASRAASLRVTCNSSTAQLPHAGRVLYMNPFIPQLQTVVHTTMWYAA